MLQYMMIKRSGKRPLYLKSHQDLTFIPIPLQTWLDNRTASHRSGQQHPEDIIKYFSYIYQKPQVVTSS